MVLPERGGFEPEGCTRGCNPVARAAGCTGGLQRQAGSRLTVGPGLSASEVVALEKPVVRRFSHLQGGAAVLERLAG